jgi:predicted tellurium resistance membrane protein TerC
VVIAMACRGLPARQRLWGMLLGAGVAIVLRILFTGIVASLMTLPFLKILGGVAAQHLWRAVQIVAVADIIMSLDNVIAIAAAAGGNTALLVLGLALSIPLIVLGAALIMAALDRYPILVWGGAALLGWIAGEVVATDIVVLTWLQAELSPALVQSAEYGAAGLGAALVLIVGGMWRRAKLKSGCV